MASIERRRTRDGKTSYSVRYRTPDGASRRRDFDRKRDADSFKVEVEDSKRRGAYVDPSAGKTRLGEHAERWYATTVALRPTTRRDYRLLLDNQVLPRFGATPLAAIDVLSVREWLAALAAGGLGAKRRREAHAVLRLVLGSAVESGRLARNVAAQVAPPKVQRREMLFLDAAQVEALAAAVREPYPVLVRFAAWMGTRPEELSALRVRHLDMLRSTVRVCEAMPLVAGRFEPGPVKTGEARTLHMPRFLRDELAAYLAGQPHAPEHHVFTMPAGGPLRPNRFVADRFRPAVRAAGLPERLRLYDLRHTCASLLIREGASIKAVQKHMGHATAAITLDTYGHLFPDELPALAERMDAARAAAVAARHGA